MAAQVHNSLDKVDSPVSANEVPCPDPSVHATNTKLQEQASTAALYVTKPDQHKDVLDHNQKLSSASAAASLKYAKPHELPSYPIVGINMQASAGKAANLANTNKKSPSYPKVETSSDAAGKAAMLAKDYKMNPLWHPEESDAGAKAALLAHRDGAKLDLWMPEASKEGNSAAGIAFRSKGLGPKLDYGYTEEGRRRALLAATGAVSGARKRSESTPTAPVALYPDAANAGPNALNAATQAHRSPSIRSARRPVEDKDANRRGSDAMEAARITHAGSNVPREMYTERPPVGIENDEKRRQEALRASAISMAKQLYNIQQRHIDGATGTLRSDGQVAAVRADRSSVASSQPDIREQALQYISLQEAAQKLAAERLAKIGTADDDAAFRSYYGYPSNRRSRLSIRRGRRRANSDTQALDSDDEEQSRRIRSQMSQFNDKLAEVDARKRQKDREYLLAAAERKVQERMHTLDEKVFAETGKASPAMMEEWEAKARAKAAADSQARMQNHGRVHLGGGRYIDQSEIDNIAAARVQPTLDQINEAAEKQRAKDEEIRLDQERKKYEAMTEKQREAELKATQKRIKEEEKAAAHARKLEEKEVKKAEKAHKHSSKDEKRKSKETARPSAEETADEHRVDEGVAGAGAASGGLGDAPEIIAERVVTAPVVDGATDRPSTSPAAVVTGAAPPATEEAATTADAHPARRISFVEESSSPSRSHGHGFRNLFSKFKRRSKASSVSSNNTEPESSADKEGARDSLAVEKGKDAEKESKRSSFIGGTALTGATHPEAATTPTPAPDSATKRSPSISSLSSSSLYTDDADAHADPNDSSDGEEIERAVRSRALAPKATSAGNNRLALLRQMSGEIGPVPPADEEGHEVFEEARDTFDADAGPVPSFGVDEKGEKGKFKEEF